MSDLLIFFALPIATIILSAVLQKILRSPLAVAAVAFAIYLIVTFAIGDETFLIATLAYTIIAFITALIVEIICKCRNNHTNTLCDTIEEVTESINENNNNTNNNGCCCNRYRYRRF